MSDRMKYVEEGIRIVNDSLSSYGFYPDTEQVCDGDNISDEVADRKQLKYFLKILSEVTINDFCLSIGTGY